MNPKDLKPNLLSTVFGGVPLSVDLQAYGEHAFSGAVARLEANLDQMRTEMWVVELVFRPEFSCDRVTGEERRPLEIGLFSHEGIARAVGDAFTARLVAVSEQRGAAA